MIQKKKFSDALTANKEVLGGLLPLVNGLDAGTAKYSYTHLLSVKNVSPEYVKRFRIYTHGSYRTISLVLSGGYNSSIYYAIIGLNLWNSVNVGFYRPVAGTNGNVRLYYKNNNDANNTRDYILELPNNSSYFLNFIGSIRYGVEYFIEETDEDISDGTEVVAS